MEATITGWVGVVLSVGAIVLGVINHRRIRSRCCGKKLELSLDIDHTAQRSPTMTSEKKLATILEHETSPHQVRGDENA